MAVFSLIFNSLLFFLLFNWSYLGERRRNPNTPERPLSFLVGYPLVLGVIFTLIGRLFKTLFIYQTLIFIIVAVLIYWVFFKSKKN